MVLRSLLALTGVANLIRVAGSSIRGRQLSHENERVDHHRTARPGVIHAQPYLLPVQLQPDHQFTPVRIAGIEPLNIASPLL